MIFLPPFLPLPIKTGIHFRAPHDWILQPNLLPFLPEPNPHFNKNMNDANLYEASTLLSAPNLASIETCCTLCSICHFSKNRKVISW